MLQAVLNQVPSSWEEENYSDKSYYLVDVSDHTEEYMKVENLVFDVEVRKIERVQNPFQYGRYMLHKEHISNGNLDPAEVTLFVAINDSQVDTALRYNCDYRRLGLSSDRIFFSNFSAAQSYRETEKVIIVKVLENKLNRHSARYPEYVVTYDAST